MAEPTALDRLSASRFALPLVCAIVWLIRYVSLCGMPGRTPAFWADWFDQSRYMTSATAFADGNLAAAAHWYPMGYSLLAGLFVGVMPSDPFFPLDLLLFVATAIAFTRVAQAYGIAPSLAVTIFLATTLIHPQLARTWLQPWNSSLSAALLWWLIVRTIAVASAPVPDRPANMLSLGALAGALPLVRPMDLLLSALFLSCAAFALWRRQALSGRAVLFVAAGFLGVTVPYLALHLAIYGPHPTAYMQALSATGFVLGDLGWKAYIILITPQPWFPETQSILERLPWLLLGAAGILASLAVSPADQRAVTLLIVAAILISAIPFIAFVDLQPPGLWRFKNIHYFKWMMPFFGLGIVLWWHTLRRPRGAVIAGAALVCVCVPLGVRVTPVAVADHQPARMLLFRGDTSRDWAQAYFGPATLTDSIGLQSNVRDYHQMPDDIGVRAIAVRRPFAADPRRDDPGEPYPYSSAARPVGRYGERLSYGVPCWFARDACSIRR